MTKRRRVILLVLTVACGLPVVALVGYLLARPSPPQGSPRIGLSMASSFVVQRPLYEDALARAGGTAVVITPTDDPARVAELLDDVDALLLSGGDDVDPAMYGGDPDQAGSTNMRRDEFEVRLIREAIKRDMPVLGICRGVQILNVAHDGTVRNLRDDEELSDRHGIGAGSFRAHEVTVAPGTRLAEVLGAGPHRVNSFHGQAVGRVGDALRVCAASDDGVVEAVERPDATFVVGIQWHPEISSLSDKHSLALFRSLVERADEYRRSRPVPSDRE